MHLSICSLLLLLFYSVTVSSSRIGIDFYDITNAVPFNGSPLTNTSSGCFPISVGLTCIANSKLDDNVTEPVGPLFDDLGAFFAFNGQSSIQFGLLSQTMGTSHVVIHFVNFPSSSIGLPSFSLFTGNTPVPFTFSDNADLSQNDSTVKNVTLIASNFGNLLRININFNYSNINWFLVSEIQIYDGFSPPSFDPILFQDGSPSLISLGPENLVSSVNITCTVATSGSFEWMWQYEGSQLSADDRFQISTFDATRTSILMIDSIRFADNGLYVCIASHVSDDSVRSNTTTKLELKGMLRAQSRNVTATVGQTVSLQCQLYGYVTVTNIQWKKGQEMIQGSGKYSFTTGGRDDQSAITAEGLSRDSFISTLAVTGVDVTDDAVYSCFTDSETIVDINLNIIEVDVSSSSPSSASTPFSTHQSSFSQQPFSSMMVSSHHMLPSTPVSRQVSSIDSSITRPSSSTPSGSPTSALTSNSNSTTVIIAVVVVMVVVILLVIAAIVLIVVVISRNRNFGNSTSNPNSVLKSSTDNRLPLGGGVGEAFYSEINEKPNKYTIIAPYSETEFLSDSSNGSMTKVVSTSHDPMYQEVPDVPTRNPPTSPPKAAINPKLLKDNPMYTSADDLDRKFSDSDFNIYAQPHLPPPIPDYNGGGGTPDMSIYNESIYSVDLNPSHFKSQESLARTENTGEESVSPYLMPYSSIYSDPEPIVKADVMEVNESHISEIKELGMGQFGRVLLAHTIGLSLKDLKLSNSDSNVSILVAVKRLSEDADQKERQAFEKEIKFMARLKHENVVSLLGICLARNAFIMMEYMENGDLNQFLQKFDLLPASATTAPPSGFLSPSILIYMCLQISSGMRYLASLNFVHRDLAARNCLVGQKYVIKIADFGMSRKLYDRNYYRIQGKAVLPIRWMSCECFYGRFSEMTDVWAFGVTMWEIFNFCRVQPYEQFSDQEVIDNAIKGQDTVLLEQPHGCPDDVYEVLVKCWHHDPMKRARFIDIHGYLSQIHAYSDMG